MWLIVVITISRKKGFSYARVQITSPLQAHRRSATGNRRAGERLSGRQPIPDFTGGYGLRQDLYHGKRDSAA